MRLPLFLLLERFISRKVVVKVMPLQRQISLVCSLYLIYCQLIVVIAYGVNSNYDNMLFYLQTACVVIAMIHMWAQPYKDESLNVLDGIILLVMVLVVNINTFPFLHCVTTEVSLVLARVHNNSLLLLCTLGTSHSSSILVFHCYDQKSS